MSVIACMPVRPIEGLPAYKHTHYEQVACPVCGELMYLGPRSKLMHEVENVPMMCMLCAVAYNKAMGGDPNPKVRHLGGP